MSQMTPWTHRLRSRTGVNALPDELLFKVHRLLPLPDLRSGVLVNKHWNKVGTPLLIDKYIFQNVVKRQGSCRFFSDNLQVIHLMRLNLKSVEPGVLARALSGVEVLNLRFSQLTSDQWVSVFTQLAKPTSKTKEIWLRGLDFSGIQTLDLSSVPSDQLAVAVSKLEVAELFHAKLKTDQLTTILDQIKNNVNETKLNILKLGGNDMSCVSPDVLPTAIIKVKGEVGLGDTRLSKGQLTSIFSTIVEKETELKQLWLWPNGKGVNKDLVIRAANKLSLSGGQIWF